MVETQTQRYERLKAAVAKQREEVAELRGRRSAMLTRLRDEFGCDSVEEGETKLKRAREKYAKLTAQLEEMLDAVEQSLGSH